MNVPALRFPEFEGEWDTQKLTQKVRKVGSGVTPRGGAEVYQSEGVPLIRSQNVRDDALDLSDVAFISEEINRAMTGSAVLPNDVLLNITGASIGRSCVVPSDFRVGNVNQHVCIIRVGQEAEPRFLQTFLASRRGQKLIFQSQSGSGREGLNFENIRAFKIAFPSLPEQKKIAAFLGVVDAKIAALRDRVAGLERYKRGLMQALFNQTLRFTQDDGTAFPDWEEKRLGEVVKTIESGMTHDQNTERHGIRVTRIETISEAKINLEKVGYVQTHLDTSQYLLECGDMLFSNINSVKHIGKIALVGGEQDLYHGMNLLRIRPDKTKAISGYLYYQLTSAPMKRHFERVCNQAVSQASINQTELKSTKLDIPHPYEQAKIAAALSAMDAKIAAVTAQLDQMQNFKKVLLQQMFV